jgi:hypothetical protein
VRYGWDQAEDVMLRNLEELASIDMGFPGAHADLKTREVTLPLVASVKDPVFSEEREWRIILVGHRETEGERFRITFLGPTPYIELGFPKEAIQEVVVGPGNYADVRQVGVRRLLDSYGCGEARVSGSLAPLRL